MRAKRPGANGNRGETTHGANRIWGETTRYRLSPIRCGFASSFVNYKKGCTRLAAASDKVYQLLANGRWFTPNTPASSTTKTGRHDIAELLLKVALKHQKSIKIRIKFVEDVLFGRLIS